MSDNRSNLRDHWKKRHHHHDHRRAYAHALASDKLGLEDGHAGRHADDEGRDESHAVRLITGAVEDGRAIFRLSNFVVARPQLSVVLRCARIAPAQSGPVDYGSKKQKIARAPSTHLMPSTTTGKEQAIRAATSLTTTSSSAVLEVIALAGRGRTVA